MRNRISPLRLVPGLHRATHRVGLYLQAADLGVTQGEAHVLAQLVSDGPSTVAALHAAFGHRRSTLTSILDRLETAGLVRREVHVDDRRSFLVSLTTRGSALARKVHALLAALESAVTARTGESDLRGFLAVVAALQAETETPRRVRR